MKTYKGMEYITLEEMKDYGYYGDGFIYPITQKQALTLWNKDIGGVLRLYPDGTEAQVDDRNEITDEYDYEVMFGCEACVDETFEEFLEWLFKKTTK